MKNLIKTSVLVTACSIMTVACDDQNSTSKNAVDTSKSDSQTELVTEKTAVLNTESETVSWPCLNPPTVSNTIPGDSVVADQSSLNCFAWQEFIGLNWPTRKGVSAANFGEPNDYAPVVFETYKTNHDLFNYSGDKPPEWDAPSQHSNDSGLRKMNRTSKFDAKFDDGDIEEAFPFKPAGQAWLADKKGNLVWYEVLMNKPEYDYFYQNEFYSSANQYKAATAGKHIDLPKGDISGKIGAMELKAAWLTVTDPNDSKWQRYKLTKAQFCTDKYTCTQSVVALVGLHIIHKTASQPSWIWATFEHIDNAPDISEVNGGTETDRYNFYDKACEEKAIPASCVDGVPDQNTSCVKNTHPAYSLTLSGGKPIGDCQPYPIQVVREYAIPDTNENPVMAINQAAQNLIKQSNADSVYQYYQLVNVMWNDSTIDENKGKELPLNALSETAFRPNPNAFPVANTTMETYIQNTACIECHSGATIANPNNLSPSFASDYSFVFGMAKAHENQRVKSDNVE